MKKTFTLIMIFAVANIYKSNAQNFYFGANGGFLKNSTIIEINNSVIPPWNKERLNTFNGGINLGYKHSKRWSFEAQLQFINLAYKERLDLLYHFQSGSITGTMLKEIDWYTNHHYIRIPILAHYNFLSEQSKFSVSLFAGPNIGFQTKQTSNFIGVNELSIDEQNSLNFEDIPLKKIDFGLQFGIRLKSQLSKSIAIYIDGTMYQGLPSIIDYPEQAYVRNQTENYDYYNIVNRYFTTNIGVLYNLKFKK